MPASESREPPPALLEAYPELRALMDRSEHFRTIEARDRIEMDGRIHYIVRGDTLGSREELFVDALCRGASPESGDLPSRALFLELPPTLKDVIRRMTRQDPEDRFDEGPGGSGPGG